MGIIPPGMNVWLMVGTCKHVYDDFKMAIIYDPPCDVSAPAVSRNLKSPPKQESPHDRLVYYS